MKSLYKTDASSVHINNLYVCMNTLISTNIKASATKFDHNMSYYCTQILFSCKFADASIQPRKLKKFLHDFCKFVCNRLINMQIM